MTDAVTCGVFSVARHHAPSMRVRALQLTDRLADTGVRLKPYSLLEEAAAIGGNRLRAYASARADLLRRVRSREIPLDVAMVQKQADYAPSLSLERALVRRGRVVYDVDDAIWVRDRSAGAHPLAFLKGARRKASWLARSADHVIAGNAILAEWLRAGGRPVTIIPSLVEVEAIAVRSHEQRDAVTLGWIGSPSTARYLDALAPVLEELRTQLPDRQIELLSVGGAPAVRVDGIRYRTVGWSVAAEREALASMDIGVMPLPNTPWTRGKCAYKALQYMAAGIPVVSDPVGVTAEIVGGGSGSVAADPRDWVDAIVAFATDAEARCRAGAAGRARVEADFSTRRWTPTVAAILRGECP